MGGAGWRGILGGGWLIDLALAPKWLVLRLVGLAEFSRVFKARVRTSCFSKGSSLCSKDAIFFTEDEVNQ